MDRERERESLEFMSFTRVCFVTRYNFFFFLVILINQFLENYKDSFISTVNKEISLVNARMCEKMNWEGSWTEIGQSEWGMEGYLGGWPRRAMLELPNDDSKFLGNCSFVIHEFSPTSLSLSLSVFESVSLSNRRYSTRGFSLVPSNIGYVRGLNCIDNKIETPNP